MFQGYTSQSANLKSYQVTHSHSGQLNNNNVVLKQEALPSSLQVVTAYHLIINRSQTQTTNTPLTVTAIIFFLPPTRHIPTAKSVRTLAAAEMESVTPRRLKKPTPLRPPTFSNRDKTDAKQKQGDNSQARTVPLADSHKSSGRAAMQQKNTNSPIQDSQSVSFSGTVLTRTIMTTLITALISARLVFWLMAPTAVAPHRWSPRTSGVRSDPVLPSSGETMILSAPPPRPSPTPKKCPLQLPSVFTAAWHQTFIKCHLYSV